MAKIYVLVGMIASGKSTYCQNAAKNGFVVVNDDSIVKLVHADNYTLYDEKLKILYKGIENQVIALAVALNKPVIIDRGLNVSIKGRKRWIALANSFDILCEAISFVNEGAIVHAKRRFEVDSRGYDYDYWLRVAERHNEVYCEPTLGEGFDAVHDVSYDFVKNGLLLL